MKRAAKILSFALAGLLAATAEAPVAWSQAGSGGPEIVVAQNNQNGFNNFFRNLFRNNRRQQNVQPRESIPFELFREERPQAAKPRRQRRSRPAAPQPQEVAAVEKAENAKRVLVVGDFMAGALAKGLADAHRENANVVVIDATSGSSGLVRADYYDWPAKLPELAAEQKPDVLLAMIGGNDRQSIDTATGSHALGSEGWRTAYAARVAALADALKATEKPVLWVGLAPVRSGAMSRDYSSFNDIVREQLEAKGIRFIETWNGFADEEGKFVAVGPDVRGQSVQLRASDGLNFTRAGQRKLAYFVEQELTDILGGASPLLAAVDPTAAAVPGEAAPAIGPMVPLDALSAAGGDVLSTAAPEDERGGAAETIAKRIAGEGESEGAAAPAAPAAPPPGRADSYIWPPQPAPAAPATQQPAAATTASQPAATAAAPAAAPVPPPVPASN
jgi:hypothetical protein